MSNVTCIVKYGAYRYKTNSDLHQTPDFSYLTRTDCTVVGVPNLPLIFGHSIITTSLVTLALLQFFDPLLCFLELKLQNILIH